jgi:ribosomal protein S18 acetylase RimI-like enzyme
MERIGRLVGLADALPEALRLAEGARRLLEAVPDELAPPIGRRLVDGVRDAGLTGRLWVGPRDEAIGLAVWERGVPAGRRAFLHLDDGFRGDAALGSFVDRLREEPGEAPLLAVQDPVPGLPASEVDRGLLPKGFERLLRVDFHDPGGPFPPDPGTDGIRAVDPREAPALAELLEASFRDNPADRALFRHELDPLDDARRSVAQILEGRFGAFWSDASYAIPDPAEPGRLLAASLVNDFNGPLLTEVMVAPAARRRGFARRLVRRSALAVRGRTELPMRLVVTLRNRRAYRLYDRLGFRRIDATLGGPWVDPAAAGVAGLDPPFDDGPGYQT